MSKHRKKEKEDKKSTGQIAKEVILREVIRFFIHYFKIQDHIEHVVLDVWQCLMNHAVELAATVGHVASYLQVDGLIYVPVGAVIIAVIVALVVYRHSS